jgi:hypothetical protein
MPPPKGLPPDSPFYRAPKKAKPKKRSKKTAGCLDGYRIACAPRHMGILCRTTAAICPFLKFNADRALCHGEFPLKRDTRGAVRRPLACIENPPRWEFEPDPKVFTPTKQPLCPDCLREGIAAPKRINANGKTLGYCSRHQRLRNKAGKKAFEKRKRESIAKKRKQLEARKANREAALLSHVPGQCCTSGSFILSEVRSPAQEEAPPGTPCCYPEPRLSFDV